MSIQNKKPSGRTTRDITPPLHLGNVLKRLIPRKSSKGQTAIYFLGDSSRQQESQRSSSEQGGLPYSTRDSSNIRLSKGNLNETNDLEIYDTRRTPVIKQANVPMAQQVSFTNLPEPRSSVGASLSDKSERTSPCEDVAQLTAQRLKEVVPPSHEIPENPRAFFREVAQAEVKRKPSQIPTPSKSSHGSRKGSQTSPTSSSHTSEQTKYSKSDPTLWPAPLSITKQNGSSSQHATTPTFSPDEPTPPHTLHRAFSHDTLFEELFEQVSSACADPQPLDLTLPFLRDRTNSPLIRHELANSPDLITSTSSVDSSQNKAQGKPVFQLCQVITNEQGQTVYKPIAPESSSSVGTPEMKVELVPEATQEGSVEEREGRLIPGLVVSTNRNAKETRVEVLVRKPKSPIMKLRSLKRKAGRILKE